LLLLLLLISLSTKSGTFWVHSRKYPSLDLTLPNYPVLEMLIIGVLFLIRTIAMFPTEFFIYV